ncbi:hypothetical protein [uncultured Coprobacter sp.]|uniref:hypothetical protein n=1 Tax=uncultured Coprobacter sp. TaxID=1720550 RepID=UPI00262A4DAA|nr:hypothetical protein [uncultured Coprobacter sp.]
MATILETVKLGSSYQDFAKKINDNFSALNESKVEQEAGKGLSTNDYTTPEKEKLAGIESGAQVNKIETISVNGVPVQIEGKAVNILQPIIEKLSLSLDAATGSIILSYDGDEVTRVDTALELIIESGTYNAELKQIELVLANGSKITIPVSQLVDTYYGDDSTITLKVVDGKQTFSISTTFQGRVTKAETDIASLNERVGSLETSRLSVEQVSFTAADARWSTSADSRGYYTLTHTVSDKKLVSPVYNSENQAVFVGIKQTGTDIVITAIEKFAGSFYVI